MRFCPKISSNSITAVVGGLACLFFFAGCAHYYVPSNRLETPEALGPGRVGRLQLVGVQSGPNLIDPATPQSTDPVTGVTPAPVLATALVHPFFAFEFPVSEKWDLGIRLQPFGPLSLRGRVQFAGEPESKAQRGNFSMAASSTAGFLLGKYGSEATFLYQWDLALLGGYRLWAHHVFTLFPFVAVAGLSGVAGSSLATGGSVSVFQYGAGFGHHWEMGAIVLRTELVYALGSSGTNQVKSIALGAVLGFQL